MRWDVFAWAAFALLLFAAEAMAPGAFMLWLGFAAAAVFVGVLLVPGIPVLAQAAAFVVLGFVSIQVYRKWFRSREQWAANSVNPSPGMIVFFDWNDPNGASGPQDGEADHVGIVEKCENGIVYTIEGNSGDACRQNQYPVGYYEILGYGILNP